MTDKIYNHTEMTEITQYNTEDAETFMGGKKYVPVFHWLQPKPDGVTELHEGYVEIGWPTDTPWDTEDYDDLILAQSGRERDIHPDAISVSPTTWTVKLAQPLVTLQLTATVTPTSSEFPVNWTSWNSNKATVSDKWLVTPVAEWEDISITATSWAVSASAVIKVEKVAVSWVTLNKSVATLAPDGTDTLTATIAPSNAYIQTVAWSSSDETVATVEDGVVTAAGVGTATITATATDDNTKTATCTVTVKIAVTWVELDESAISLAPNATQQLTATVSPDNATVSTVSRSSSDENVATVNNWLVTAVADGEAIITATSTDDTTKTATCTVTVETPAVENPSDGQGK